MYMCADMDLQSARTGVGFVADSADEGFVSRVNELMGLEVAFSNKLLIAAFVGADKGTLSSLRKGLVKGRIRVCGGES